MDSAIVFLCLLASSIQDESVERKSIEDKIKDGLESIREVMTTGTGDIQILDPLKKDHILFDLKEIGAEGTLDTRDVVVEHLSTFVVNDIKFAKLALRLTFDLAVPELLVTAGIFNLSGSDGDQKVQTNGTASFTLDNIGVRGSARVRIPWSSSGVIQIYDTRIKVYMTALRSEVEDPVHEDINNILEDLVPQFVVSHEADISNFLNPTVENAVNKILKERTSFQT